MMGFWILLKLKILEKVGSPVLLLLFFALPLIFGGIAGYGNVINRNEDIRLSIWDQDKTAESRQLIGDLRSGGWQIDEGGAAEGRKKLQRREVEAFLEILPGYSENLSTLKETKLLYTQAEGTMTEVLVREVITATVLPIYAKKSLAARLEKLYKKKHIHPPEKLEAKFDESIQKLLAQNPVFELQFIGKIPPQVRKTYVVTDYSLEILFLSIYGILGMYRSGKELVRKRLCAIPGGFCREYLTELTALIILGVIQIIAYSGAMSFLMENKVHFSGKEMGILTVFLLSIVAFGQVFQLMESSFRLFASLMLLLLSAVFGGCFFQLPGNILEAVGQYTPHGWALSALRGYHAASPFVVIVLSFGLLIAGYFGQKRQLIHP